MKLLPVLAALVPFALAGVFLLPHFATPPAAAPLSAYTEGSSGARTLAALARTERSVANIGSDLRLLASAQPPETLLVMLGVPQAPTAADREELEHFVEAGGRVLVLDDVGYANDLARDHGVLYYRIELQDEDFVGNQSLVRTTLRLPDGDYEVILNRPTALRVEAEAQGDVWARSGNGSFLDLDGDRTVGLEDRTGPFELAFATKPNALGGRWVFLSDADTLSDGMLAFAENQAAATALFDLLVPPDGLVLFDERDRIATPTDAALNAALASALEITSSWPVRALLLAMPLAALPFLRRLDRDDSPPHRHDLTAPCGTQVPEASDVSPLAAPSKLPPPRSRPTRTR